MIMLAIMVVIFCTLVVVVAKIICSFQETDQRKGHER